MLAAARKGAQCFSSSFSVVFGGINCSNSWLTSLWTGCPGRRRDSSIAKDPRLRFLFLSAVESRTRYWMWSRAPPSSDVPGTPLGLFVRDLFLMTVGVRIFAFLPSYHRDDADD